MAGDNPAFLAWTRIRPCRARGLGPCDGQMEAHHAGSKGLSQRPSDETAIPLCTWHHRCFHGASNDFGGWDKNFRRSWMERQIEYCQRAWARAAVDGVIERIEEKRPERRCSECRELGHDRRKCPVTVAKRKRLEKIRKRVEARR